MTYERWDVVAVEYPFIEGYETKRRPALIVSSGSLRDAHNVYWLAMVTTAKAGVRSDDVPIDNHAAAGLPENCVIRVPRLATLGDAQIARRLGTIGTRERRVVSALLKRFLPA